MKALVLVLALLPTVASAETLLEARCNAVGVVQLTDEPSSYCDESHPLTAIVTDPDDMVSPACYTLTKSEVEVQWYDGVTARYALRLFKKS